MLFESDVIRFESLQTLKAEACQRLLEKNYGVLFAMTPTSEVVPACKAASLPLYGSPSSHFLSPWFRLFMYTTIEAGPPSLLYPKGFCISELPSQLSTFASFRLEQMGSGEVHQVEHSRLLVMANNMLLQSPLMIQPAFVMKKTTSIVFPITAETRKGMTEAQTHLTDQIIQKLSLNTSLGCIKLVNLPPDLQSAVPSLLPLLPESLDLGIPIANSSLNLSAMRATAECLLMDKDVIQQHIQSMENLNSRLNQFVLGYSQGLVGSNDSPSSVPTQTKSAFAPRSNTQPRSSSLSADAVEQVSRPGTFFEHQSVARLGVVWSLPCVPLFFDGRELCVLPDPFDS